MKTFPLSFFFYLISYSTSFAQLGFGTTRPAESNFSQYLMKTIINSTDGRAVSNAPVTELNKTPNTEGKRFLFDRWVKGDSVITVQDGYVSTKDFLFNYDRLTGNLIVTQDRINIMAVAPSGLRSFILKDNDTEHYFKRADLIDSSKFLLVVVKSDADYSLYKQLSTKFTKSDFRDDGLIKSGNRFDEYKEDNSFFIVHEKTGRVQLVNNKPKTIKAIFSEDEDLVRKFFRNDVNRRIDEQFLIDLVKYVNLNKKSSVYCHPPPRSR